jgi:ABC-type phosphate transport system permease subunit
MSAGQVVAKKSGDKAGKGESRRFGVLVRLAGSLVANAKIVASMRGISMAEYLSERFAPIVEQDLEEEMKKRLKGKSN